MPQRPQSVGASYQTALLIVLLCAIAAASLPRSGEGVVESDGPSALPPAPVETRIDPNQASLASLVRLPRIGEVLAARIIAYRTARAGELSRRGQPGPAFLGPEDLHAIRGLGPKTVEGIAPLLRFPPQDGGRRAESPATP